MMQGYPFFLFMIILELIEHDLPILLIHKLSLFALPKTRKTLGQQEFFIFLAPLSFTITYAHQDRLRTIILMASLPSSKVCVLLDQQMSSVEKVVNSL